VAAQVPGNEMNGTTVVFYREDNVCVVAEMSWVESNPDAAPAGKRKDRYLVTPEALVYAAVQSVLFVWLLPPVAFAEDRN